MDRAKRLKISFLFVLFFINALSIVAFAQHRLLPHTRLSLVSIGIVESGRLAF
jgi:hypothetical protein